MRDSAEPVAEAGAPAWEDAVLAAWLLAVDPVGLGGATLRARAGPARDAWMDLWRDLTPERPMLRLPPGTPDDRLLGGLDLAGTLAAGRPVRSPGLLAEASGRTLVLTMAERCPSGLAARIAAAQDAGAAFALIALDEGAAPDEAAPSSLTDRLAFAPRLDGLPLAALAPGAAPCPAEVVAAQARLRSVRAPGTLAEAFVGLGLALGIGSLRAPLLALNAARAAAALFGDDEVGEAAAAAAVRLVLAPRATRLPPEPPPADDDPPDDPPDSPPPDTSPDTADASDGDAPTPDEAEGPDDGGGRIPDDVLVEAARAAIPSDLLARLLAAGALRTAGGASAAAGDDGAGRKGGRPVGSMRGALRDGARLDLIETLRAAAAWQPLRRRLMAEAGAQATPGRVLVRPDDFRLKRFRRRAERVVIFVVDASGSAALARLAEAKGAVELMLAQAYVARQQVALVSFRGAAAEVLLPPTRSLVMTKRRLASLPGGGGTPLAAGLAAAMDLARLAKSRGTTPYLAVLTDGKANIALDGAPGRPQAEADARRIAQALRVAGVRSILIDTGNRPAQSARDLATAMGGAYLPLPRADARMLSAAMRSALDGPG